MTYTLITGASYGIGQELAKEFAKHGHNLIIAARTAYRLEALKAELESAHSVKVETFAADLSIEEERNRLFAYTQDNHLEVEILVNNAGFGDGNAFLDAPWERQKNMVELNVLALMHLSYLYGAEMKKRGHGKIMNIASAAAFSAGPYMPVYYASKAFVLSLSEAMYEELKGSGVTVTAICPGPTTTCFEKNAGMENANMFHVSGVETPEAVAKCAYDGMMKEKPIVCHGRISRSFSFYSRLIPRSAARKSAIRMNYQGETK